MTGNRINHYEKAFGSWLIDNHVHYIAVDEAKRAAMGAGSIKSFDFLIYPPGQKIVVAEVKGRKFRGATLAGLRGFECWVTTDDIDGLSKWEEVFGAGHNAVFVFAYHLAQVDVDCDGREVYEFDNRRYLFFGIRLSDYTEYMVMRSPKWRTVTLGAKDFRRRATQMNELVL